MSIVSQDGVTPTPGTRDVPPPYDWVAALTGPEPERTDATQRLHALLVRAARHQVGRMGATLPGAGAVLLDELANSAADEAAVAVLRKLADFEGRSQFTTWAYKFAILEAATLVRRHAWSHREMALPDHVEVADRQPGPDQHAEASDLARAVASSIREDLTPHQRRIAIALLVDEVPIDVLADRLGTTRGALYKTLHDVRLRVRARLTALGYLPTQGTP